MVDPCVLALAQLLDIAHSRNDKPIQSLHGSSYISDILALLQFELVAVLVNRLSGFEFRLGCGIVELIPEIGDGEDGIGALEGA